MVGSYSLMIVDVVVYLDAMVDGVLCSTVTCSGWCVVSAFGGVVCLLCLLGSVGGYGL